MVSPVSNIEEFTKKWGSSGWRLLLEMFIARAPAFQGDEVLAKEIGRFTADLESALISSKKQKSGVLSELIQDDLITILDGDPDSKVNAACQAVVDRIATFAKD